MDKVFSARVDEAIVNKIGVLARELHTTKKTIIERAVNLFLEKVEKERSVNYYKCLLFLQEHMADLQKVLVKLLLG